jgi:hypothetical protein
MVRVGPGVSPSGYVGTHLRRFGRVEPMGSISHLPRHLPISATEECECVASPVPRGAEVELDKRGGGARTSGEERPLSSSR